MLERGTIARDHGAHDVAGGSLGEQVVVQTEIHDHDSVAVPERSGRGVVSRSAPANEERAAKRSAAASKSSHTSSGESGAVNFTGADPLVAVEKFYAQSEQYPLRIKLSDNSDTAVGLVALPEYDEEWVRSVPIEEATASPEVERHFLRTVHFKFACDCSPEKLLPFFRSMSSESLQDLYGSDDELQITCPRCGRQFGVHRSEIAEN